MTKQLTIRSIDNQDWNGNFVKSQVEQEMRDIGNDPKDSNDWVYWVIDHLFDDCEDLTPLMEKFIAECDSMAKLELHLANGNATFTKI